MTFDDLAGKAKAFLSNDKVTDALHSEKAEDVSDTLLDKVADAADNVTGGKFHDQLDTARDEADKHVGNQ
jgi:hypothetical protein